MNINAINADLSGSRINSKKHSYLNSNSLSYATSVVSANSLEQMAKVNEISVNKPNKLVHLSFTGNADKNMKQFLFFSAEDKADGLNKIYSLGGEGVVVQEAGNNWAEQYADKGIDIRKFKVYHSYDNKDGGIKVLTSEKDEEGKPKFKTVPQNYTLEGDEKFVILEEPNNGKSAFKIIEDANIKGAVKRIDSKLELESVPYRLFKFVDPKHTNMISYYIHTKDLAAFPAAYGVGSDEGADGAYGGAGGSGSTDYKYSTGGVKELIDIAPKLNNEENGFYKPGNIWLHDRQAFPFVVFASEESSKGNEYYNGLRMHNTFHNPGANYQGRYNNPIEFFRIVGSEDDLNSLKENKADFNFVKDMYRKINDMQNINYKKFKEHPETPNIKEYLDVSDILSEEENEKLTKIFEPVIGSFRDDYGNYNLCEIPVQGVRKNAFNVTAGTVSRNYGKEMKNYNTPEIADGITNDLNSIPTIDIVNGSTPANMKTNEIGSFGRPGNLFNTDEIKNGYTPFEVKLSADGKQVLNLDEVVEAKKKNTKWLINTIADATKKGQDALNKLFFNEEQLNPKDKNIPSAGVLGGFTEYSEGDKVFIGWGRPDSQKGFPTTFESFLNYIKNPNITKEEKLHAKLLVGAGGPNPWAVDAPDWKKLQELVLKIAEVDNGVYKNNVCYVNGFFANRLANAASIGDLTSVYEPCGITPLESYAAGNPVASIKTGGAPDFVEHAEPEKIMNFLKNNDKDGLAKYLADGNKTGFLTKHAYLVKPEVIGKDKNLKGVLLNDARREALGAEMADCMHLYMQLVKDENLEKILMQNSLLQLTDWHNNSAYNGGKSANERYMGEVFQLDENLNSKEPRFTEPLKNLKGKFKKVIQKVAENVPIVGGSTSGANSAVKKSFLSSKAGKFTIIGTSLAAVGGFIYGSYLHNKKKLAQQNQEDKTQETTISKFA